MLDNAHLNAICPWGPPSLGAFFMSFFGESEKSAFFRCGDWHFFCIYCVLRIYTIFELMIRIHFIPKITMIAREVNRSPVHFSCVT